MEFEKVLKAIEKGQRSPYYGKFTQGTTVVPRQVWFVEPAVHPRLGIDPTKPRLKTSQRAIDRAKPEYADVRLDGEVESKFLYHVVTGSELAPFCTITAPIAVLPIEPSNSIYRIVNSDEAKRRGYSGLRNWLVKAEKVWKEKRGEKAGRMNIYQRLDYSRGLTNQSSRKKYKVLYNTSGTYLVACLVKNEPSKIRVDSSSLGIQGVLGESTTYWFDTNNRAEGLFVAAMLNAPIVDALIKPMQSRGLWGERHIHKKVLELPLPEFNPKNKTHMKLVEIAEDAEDKANMIIRELEAKYSSIGKIRQLVKVELSEDILRIDRIARKLIAQIGNNPNSLSDFFAKSSEK